MRRLRGRAARSLRGRLPAPAPARDATVAEVAVDTALVRVGLLGFGTELRTLQFVRGVGRWLRIFG